MPPQFTRRDVLRGTLGLAATGCGPTTEPRELPGPGLVVSTCDRVVL